MALRTRMGRCASTIRCASAATRSLKERQGQGGLPSGSAILRSLGGPGEKSTGSGASRPAGPSAHLESVKTHLTTELASCVDGSKPEMGHSKDRKGKMGTEVVGPRSDS